MSTAKERFAKLKNAMRLSSPSGKIIEIPRGQNNFRCQSKSHGRETMLHSFSPRIDEIECDCGLIYKRAQ